MTPVLKSAAFEQDFEHAALYLSDAHPPAGVCFVDAVDAAIEMLAEHPRRYLLVPGFHNYLMFYRYEQGEVRLGRLLHGAQDLKDVLGD